MNRFAKLATAVVVAALVVAVPAFAQRGSADFSKLVALGDSYGAGVVSSSLNERHQVWSWPAVIARQVGYTTCAANAVAGDPCFAQPLVAFPGIGPELELRDLTPTIAPAGTSNGTPLMVPFGRAYNNLSIPGATVGALLTLTGAEPQQPGEPTAVSMARFILRGRGTAIAQAIEQQPTFIVMWIGGNDALSTLFSGTPATLTPAADFRTRYAAVLNELVTRAPNAGIVVGNLPTQPLPYQLLISRFIVNSAGQPVPGPDGNPIPLIGTLDNGAVGPLPAGSFVLLHARTNLQTGFGLPNVPPFNQLPLPNVGKPLPDSDVITPTEFATIIGRINEYNAAIQAEAQARNIPVADIKGLFDRVYAPGGLHVGPVTVTPAPVTGGFFGLDFFHLTDLGYLLFANEYIKTINSAYDTEIPVAGITQLFANNGAFFPDTDGNPNNVVVTDAAAQQIRSMWAQAAMRKLRVARH